jgi:hypothetical protein
MHDVARSIGPWQLQWDQLANDIVPSISSSEVAKMIVLKNRQVPLLHSII